MPKVLSNPSSVSVLRLVAMAALLMRTSSYGRLPISVAMSLT